MKILNIIQRYPPSIGGAEYWCRIVSEYLSQMEIRVKVLTLNVFEEDEFWGNSPIPKKIIDFGRIEFVGKIKIIRCKRNKIPSLLFQLFKIIDRRFGIYFYGPHSVELYIRLFKEIKNSDLVHLHTLPYPHNTIAIFIAKLFNKKIVFSPHFHIGHPSYERKFNYWLMKKCDAIFAVSEFEKEHLIKNEINKKNIFITYNSVDPNKYFKKDENKFKERIYKQYNLSDQTKIILFIGRKVEYKGIRKLIEAFKNIKRKIPSSLFLIGPNFPWWEEFYTQLDDLDKKDIIDLGIVSHQVKVNFLHISDLLVLPSEYEAFGIVFLEAWLCKTPVVGSNRGAIPYIIKDAGLTFNYESVNELETQILKILQNEELSKRFVEQGRKKVNSDYKWESIGRNILNVYENLIGKTATYHSLNYNLEEFLGKGWYSIERRDGKTWVWSRKEAFLNLPSNENGITLEFSVPTERVGTIYLKLFDLKKNLIKESKIIHEISKLDVPFAIRKVKLVVSDLTKPSKTSNNDDNRELGVCLHKISNKKIYNEICSWYPSNIEIETTTVCNINPPCVMCRRNLTREENVISPHIIDRIEDLFKYASVISLSGVGEPLTDENLFRIMNLINKKETHIKFTTNGLLLTKDVSEKLLEKGLKEITISIDAATSETYKRIRRNDGFCKVKNNVQQLVSVRDKKKVTYPFIEINMVLMQENFNELVKFIEMADEIGVDGVYFSLLSKIEKNDNYIIKDDNNGFKFDYQFQMIDTKSEEFKQKLILAIEKCRDLKINLRVDNKQILEIINSYQENNIPLNNLKCKNPWENLIIDLNGDVRLCCHSNRVIGNLNSCDFENIWNGLILRRIRKYILNNKLSEECRNCPME